jgi:hypothetical protein
MGTININAIRAAGKQLAKKKSRMGKGINEFIDLN